MSKSLGLHVFPSNNQDQATQEADEAECYKWAINQTRYDPINPTVVQSEQVDTSADGTAVKSSARSADLAADYNKAFAVCMEGKGYSVK